MRVRTELDDDHWARTFDAAPETPEAMAAAIAAGEPVMWCDWPVLDGTATAAGHLLVHGWAYCGGGVGAIVVIAGGRCYEARTGLPRPDVHERLPGLEADVSGFAVVIDTREWPAGPQEVSVRAKGLDGGSATRTGVVHIGEDLPYRSWLQRSTGRQPSPSPPPGAPRLAVHFLPGPGASGSHEDALASQTYSRWARADGTLADTLKAVAAGGAAVLVSNHGTLPPHALAALAAAMGRNPAPDLVYADEDAMMPDGERGDAFFKPGWSPELLLSTDYVGPVVGIGPRAASAALAAETQPPQTIYELLLRVVDAALNVERIPQVLFTSHAPRMPADDPRTRDAIARLGARRGRRAQVVALERPGARDVRWELDREPLVSVVIPTSFAGGRLTDCLRSLRERTSYSNLEVVIVDSSAGGLASVDELLEWLPHRVVPYRGPFNFSTAVNMGARAASGDCLLLLNDDTEVRSADWVERMLEHLLTPGVGVVGCTLLYPSGTVQHAGVVLAVGASGSWHVHWGLPADAPGYRGMLQMTRNHSAVTGACMMVATELFAELGGLDESFASEFSDIDLCLRAIERRRRVVCTPRAVLTHHERSSLPMRVNAADSERFTERWRARYACGDPFYHPAFLPPSYELPPQPGGAPPTDSLLPMEARDPREGLDPLPTVGGVEEFESPPPTIEGLVESIANGRTAMWCEAPPLDGKARAVCYLDISGWAYSRAGIEGIYVYLDELRYQARHGAARPDLTAVSDDLSRSGFELTIELAEHQAGPLDLAVVARGADGHTVGMRGTVECRPGSDISATPHSADGAGGASEANLARLQLAEERRREAERMLDELQRSLSWRVTRPLRWGKRMLRRGWSRASAP